jgi:hypothetical protein
VAGFCEHGNEPSGSIKKPGYCLTSWVTMSFSKNILYRGVSERVSKYWVSSPKFVWWVRFQFVLVQYETWPILSLHKLTSLNRLVVQIWNLTYKSGWNTFRRGIYWIEKQFICLWIVTPVCNETWINKLVSSIFMHVQQQQEQSIAIYPFHFCLKCNDTTKKIWSRCFILWKCFPCVIFPGF